VHTVQTGLAQTGGHILIGDSPETQAPHTGVLADPCKGQLGNQKKGLLHLMEKCWDQYTVALGHALGLGLFLGLYLALCWNLHLHISPAWQVAVAVQDHAVEAAVKVEVDEAAMVQLGQLQGQLEG
jgi:hypothetical protein